MDNSDNIVLSPELIQCDEQAKIVTIVGARPQFIKSAMLSLALEKKPQIKEVLVHTGQHFDANMSQVFFDDLQMESPKYNLEIQNECSDEAITLMQAAIEKILIVEHPNLVVVFGDTKSTLAGARAAKAMGIKVAHIEAGMRSFEAEMPEEKIRLETDSIADYFYCASQRAVENLRLENLGKSDAVFFVGDLMRDASNYFLERDNGKSAPDLANYENFVLCTFHRADNVEHFENLSEIVRGINRIHAETPVVIPLHPRTKSKLEAFGLSLDAYVIPPQGFFDMMRLLQKCQSVITDSGGLQKEAYFFGKKCLVIREKTEWTELLERDRNVLVQADANQIHAEFRDQQSRTFGARLNLYGNGNAAQDIAQSFQKLFNFTDA